VSLYGVCISFSTQRAICEEYCHGPKCGKGIVAFLDAGPGIGVIMPCREDECPVQASLLSDMPLDVSREFPGDADAGQMVLRKLAFPDYYLGA